MIIEKYNFMEKFKGTNVQMKKGKPPLCCYSNTTFSKK
jgi:hypothetical protein